MSCILRTLIDMHKMRFVKFAVLSLVAIILPAHAQLQDISSESANIALLNSISQRIQRAEAHGRLSISQAAELREQLKPIRVGQLGISDLRRHAKLTPEGSERLRAKEEGFAKELQHLSSLVPDSSEATKPEQKTWPPRDSSGRIIMGPRRGGTREQIGWPLYGWTQEDRMKWEAQQTQKNNR
jgi:hypothetical protein